MEKAHGHESLLLRLAGEAMVSHGLEPDFPTEALRQLEGIREAAHDVTLPDLTQLPWCSIDNDDSRDLDQITASERLSQGAILLRVAVADVDALVKPASPLDLHAKKNTTSVYTGVRTFPMLPEKLSTDFTSLNPDEERIALVIEMEFDAAGRLTGSKVHRARVRNKAKLTYHGVAAWLDGKGPLPEPAARVPGMDEQLRTQDETTGKMRAFRHEQGALELETLQPRAVMREGVVIDLMQEPQNRAEALIEDLMVAANGVTTRYLVQNKFPTLRRVVRSPERWGRIVEVARNLGEELPPEPDSKALAAFLTRQRTKDPLRFPDLSLTVVKLMGRGEYVPEVPGQPSIGHFGLAVKDYSHSTAPNRRYPDLITHRLLKAVLNKSKPPYSTEELSSLAAHCTRQENEADKVERQVRKSASASFLAPRIGEHFDAIVTGASDKGTWVRLFRPSVEGKLVQGARGLDVGDRVRVKLIDVSVENGWIDFARSS